MQKKPKRNNSFYLLLLSLSFWLMFFLSTLFPESWWGIHYLSFLSPIWKFGLLGIGLGLMVYAYLYSTKSQLFDKLTTLYEEFAKWPILIIIVIGMGLVYYNFPIYHDIYGDSERFDKELRAHTEGLTQTQKDALFSFNIFHAKNGEISVLNTVQLIAYKSEIPHTVVFQIMGVLCGMGFIMIWLVFLNVYLSDPLLKLLLSIVGLVAPFTLQFYGHMEIYAPSIVVVMAYFMGVLLFIKEEDKRYIWLLGSLLYISIKLHSAAFLLIPSFFLVILHYYSPKYKWIGKIFNWKTIFSWGILPIFAVGAFVYFFVLQDHIDSRVLSQDTSVYDRLFLPLIAPAPPLDRYTLLGGYHIFDFVNAILMWSPEILFVIGAIGVGYAKKINWNSPAIIVLGISLLLYTALLFMINPLLSMPIDWDLYSLPAPILWLFLLALLPHLNQSELAAKVALPVLALSLLSIPIFIVHNSPQALSYRLESMGKHVFKSYWVRAAGDIYAGIDLLQEDQELTESRMLNTIDELKPYANEGNDAEYSFLLWRVGKHYRTTVRDMDKALTYHQEAYAYNPKDGANLVGLLETYFILGEFEKAFQYSVELVKIGYPSRQQSLRIATHCALEAEMYDQAKDASEAYLMEWPDDESIKYIYDNLVAGTNLGELKKVFGGG